MPGLTRTRRSATGRATAAAPAPVFSSAVFCAVFVLTADAGRAAAPRRRAGTTL
ncbi:hypothetical protein HTV80_05960 [Streptomyces sp. Vc74B-19]|uniref:hypothetical protein n=1 Tax=unclassified Streptomyces TaxID=2593676 RepID=UPI001BFC0E32|nr:MULTISPECIES: hypothetical protein [unclassified Streptomyces]MBT3162652.1 hypothetical protein [Streptomyces sp. Vc74B-19]MCO4694518.1 hypothetical protein [Streptomyces sp. RO-S4]MDU0305559.1 hypothetical protein [Streptomyces sp. PAL114]